MRKKGKTDRHRHRQDEPFSLVNRVSPSQRFDEAIGIRPTGSLHDSTDEDDRLLRLGQLDERVSIVNEEERETDRRITLLWDARVYYTQNHVISARLLKTS
jgi:hypothetical protein